MLRTDLDGLMTQVKESPVAKLAALMLILVIIYCVVSRYLSNGDSKNNFSKQKSISNAYAFIYDFFCTTLFVLTKVVIVP